MLDAGTVGGVQQPGDVRVVSNWWKLWEIFIFGGFLRNQLSKDMGGKDLKEMPGQFLLRNFPPFTRMRLAFVSFSSWWSPRWKRTWIDGLSRAIINYLRFTLRVCEKKKLPSILLLLTRPDGGTRRAASRFSPKPVLNQFRLTGATIYVGFSILIIILLQERERPELVAHVCNHIIVSQILPSYNTHSTIATNSGSSWRGP